MKTHPVSTIILTTLVTGIVIIYVALQTDKPVSRLLNKPAENISTLGVCPPFFLLTDDGDTINPVKGKNADEPYSPRQTCGICHPGGGPLEFDRQGLRYDKVMADETRGYVPALDKIIKEINSA